MPLTDIDGQRLGDSCADKLGNAIWSSTARWTWRGVLLR